jgi:hypothetical protein
MDTRRNKLKKQRRKHNKSIRKDKHNNPNLLLYSSLVFTTNIISSFYKEYYTYGFLFILLTITSLFFHSHSTLLTNIVDKVSIFCIISLISAMISPNCIYRQNIIITHYFFELSLNTFVFGYGHKRFEVRAYT